jgi:putative oxidoreductase
MFRRSQQPEEHDNVQFHHPSRRPHPARGNLHPGRLGQALRHRRHRRLHRVGRPAGGDAARLGAAIFELVAGLFILVGFRTREDAWLLAAFCLFAGFVFHFQPEDQMQMISFMKNVAIAGGFLSLAVAGAGALSVDERLGTAKPAIA